MKLSLLLSGVFLWLMMAFSLPFFHTSFAPQLSAQPQAAQFAQVGQIGDPEFQSGNSVIADKNGAIYIAGQFKGTISFGSTTLTSVGSEDIFVTKLQNGAFQWAMQGSGDLTENVTSIALDGNGDVYICGSFNSTAIELDAIIMTNTQPGTYDAFVYKLDQNIGAVLWSQSGGGLLNDGANDVAIDRFNQIYVTGYFEDNASFSGQPVFPAGKRDIFTARYNDIGNLVWIEQAGGERDDYGSSVVIDTVGTVFVSGAFSSDNCIFAFLDVNNTDIVGTYDPFIVAYDSTRIPIWVQGGGGFGNDYANALAIDSTSSELYVTGAYTNSATFGNFLLVNENTTGTSIYLAKYDDAGNALWATKGDGPNAEALKVTLDYNGNVYTTGRFTEELNFGCTGLSESYSNLGGVNLDIFVTKHTTDGEFLNAHRAGSDNAPDEGRDVYFSPFHDKLLITGYFSDTTAFSNVDTKISFGAEDIFLAVVNYQTNACGVPTRVGRRFKNIVPACEFSEDTIFYTGFTGRIKRWERSEDNGSTYQPLDVKTAYYPIGQIRVPNTIIRAVIQSCDCDSIMGDTTRLDAIYAPTKGGNISGSKTVCFLSNNGDLTLLNHIGGVLRWESSTDDFSSNILQIANTTNVYSYVNVTVNTKFRAVLQNGLCATAFSDTALITADSCSWCGQQSTIGGTAVVQGGGPTSLCITSNIAAVQLVGYLGVINRWEVSNDDFGTIQVYPGGSPTLQILNITQKNFDSCASEKSKLLSRSFGSCNIYSRFL